MKNKPSITKAANPSPIELSPNQRSPKDAKPEDFVVHQWSEGVSVSGQRSNDAEAEAKNYRVKGDTGSNYNDAIRVDEYGNKLTTTDTDWKSEGEPKYSKSVMSKIQNNLMTPESARKRG